MMNLDHTDRVLVLALQGGLPLDPQPWKKVAEQVGLAEDDVLKRVGSMMEKGVIRRVAALPNHYRLGMVANGMSVWDVDDASVKELGQKVGQLPFVTHCYRRSKHMPNWPYNLFAMLHGSSREEVEEKRKIVAEILGSACRSNDILYSTRILKKTGLRFNQKGA